MWKVIAAVALVGVVGCAGQSAGSAEGSDDNSGPIINASGERIGTVTFLTDGAAPRVRIEATGLPPGEHGAHLHQSPQCTPPSFESAGGHYNPTNRSHGAENPNGPHAGDLPNVTVGDDGKLNTTLTAAATTMASGFDPGSVSLVIHADRDDLRTDPSGNSGGRIACGSVG